MSDGLPNLLPNDPQNLLSVEARKRIQRAHIESNTFVWKAEAMIEQLDLETRSGKKAEMLRNEARFKKAKAILAVFRKEFSAIVLTERKYREIMREEIEGASNSLQLSGIQQRLLETQFFFREENIAPPQPISHPILPKQETVGSQINALREECHLTLEELAEEIDMDIRSVQRHLANEITPYARHLRVYERVFSKLLNRQVVVRKMP